MAKPRHKGVIAFSSPTHQCYGGYAEYGQLPVLSNSSSGGSVEDLNYVNEFTGIQAIVRSAGPFDMSKIIETEIKLRRLGLS